MPSPPPHNRVLEWMLDKPDPVDEMEMLDSDDEAKPPPKKTRGPSKIRQRYEGELKLRADYFVENSVYSDADFERRFRITKTLFLRIKEEIIEHDEYFLQKRVCAFLLPLSHFYKHSDWPTGLHWHFGTQHGAETHGCVANAWVQNFRGCHWPIFLNCRFHHSPITAPLCPVHCCDVQRRISLTPKQDRYEEDSLWKLPAWLSWVSREPRLYSLELEKLSCSLGRTV